MTIDIDIVGPANVITLISAHARAALLKTNQIPCKQWTASELILIW